MCFCVLHYPLNFELIRCFYQQTCPSFAFFVIVFQGTCQSIFCTKFLHSLGLSDMLSASQNAEFVFFYVYYLFHIIILITPFLITCRLDRAASTVALLFRQSLVLILRTLCLLKWDICFSRSFHKAVNSYSDHL